MLLQHARLLARTRRYVSKIAHDLNHPLAVLRNGLPGGDGAAVLRRQIDRMAGLVDRYANLARAIGTEAGVARADIQARVAFQFDTASSYGTQALPSLLIEDGAGTRLLAGGYLDADTMVQIITANI